MSLKHKKIAHPFILVFITAASIFIAEALVMMVLPFIKGISPVYEGTIDALLLTVLVFPVLYLFLFRPMISVIRSLSEAEDELQMANEELEARVAIRTSELAWANDSLKKEMEERVKIEGDLRDSEKRYRCLWEDMNDAAFLADAETGRITDANRSAKSLLRTRKCRHAPEQPPPRSPWVQKITGSIKRSREYRRHGDRGEGRQGRAAAISPPR